jgi:hypothetical protein
MAQHVLLGSDQPSLRQLIAYKRSREKKDLMTSSSAVLGKRGGTTLTTQLRLCGCQRQAARAVLRTRKHVLILGAHSFHVRQTKSCPFTAPPMDPAPRLACQQCKQRKLRCDKGSPCNACRAAGLVCQVVQRARLPRGKSAHGGKKQMQKQSLETRLKQLEALLDQHTKVKPNRCLWTPAING